MVSSKNYFTSSVDAFGKLVTMTEKSEGVVNFLSSYLSSAISCLLMNIEKM